MGLDRKSFLEVAFAGGLGLLVGGASVTRNRWRERGVQLVSVQRSSLLMGSIVQFEVVAGREKDGFEAINRAVALFRKLDKKLSMYDSESEMAALSRYAGKRPVHVSKDALEVLRYAKDVWGASGGKFDVTVEPAMRRWGFRKDPGAGITPPDGTELRKLEKLIGSDKLIIQDELAFLEQPGMAVDLGGIAGGYALDCAIEELKKMDLVSAFINFSGDIHCFGNPVDKMGWPVHILDPRTKEPIVQPVILQDEALSTSGAYQNRRSDDSNQSWGHLLTPRDARPVGESASVTAIHSSAMVADTWSTAGYIGSDRRKDIKWIVL